MPKTNNSLAELYSRFEKRQGSDWCERFATPCRERRRAVQTLSRHGIITVANLVARFAKLPPRAKHSAIDLIAILKIRQAIPVLLAALPDRAVRLACADVLWQLEAFTPAGKSKRVLQEIGWRELESPKPDREWLKAVVLGLGYADDRQSADLLLTIFERRDLPGPVRGDAGDKLGFSDLIYDRRTSLYRRCRAAALRGLFEDSIDVQFWSMYVIASLCNVRGSRPSIDKTFRSALPKLREFAANDHRLAPGFWWPMSAEAEDAIACIQNGVFPENDAAERWLGNKERGKMTDD